MRAEDTNGKGLMTFTVPDAHPFMPHCTQNMMRDAGLEER